jgi:hypothetical protein
MSPTAIGQQRAPKPVVATATLAGTLVTDESSPRPVRRAVLRLTGADDGPRVTSTDDEGRFVFPKLPAGRYSLSATKTGYVTTFYGSKRPGHGPGVPIVITDGTRADVSMKMAHGAVITGTIADEQGQPMANLVVQVLDAETRVSAPTGSVRSMMSLMPNNPPMSATTDDRGVYRVFGLAPGTYVVAVLPRTGNTNTTNVATFAVTDDEVRWAQAQAAAGGHAPAAPPPPGQAVTYAPVYYPGTADVGVAQAVTVAAGEEHSGASFPLRLVPTANITGTIVDSGGQSITPVSATLVRKPGPRSAVASWLSPSFINVPRASVVDNAFTFANVTPGDYLLVARTGGGTRGRVAADAAPPSLWAIVDLAVEGRDQRDLVVRLLPGTKISGSVVFEGTSLQPPADLSALTVTLAPILSLPGMPAPIAYVAPAGTFVFQSVVPTIFDLRIGSPPSAGSTTSHWMLKSAMVNGHDVADTPIDLKGIEELTGLTITFTDRTTEIGGSVIGAAGRPAAAYSAVVFPADRALWSPTSRRIKAIPLATNSTYRIADLPPGRYCLAVVDDLDPADLASADFLTQLQAASTTITLAEGEHKAQDVKIGG